MFDPSQPPTRTALHPYLGPAALVWETAIRHARKRAPQLTEAWHFAGLKIGWSLRLVDGDRIVVYLTPLEGAFRIGLVLGAKAVAAARAAGLSPAAETILDAAPKHAEGHGVRFLVASSADMTPFDELLAIKLAGPAKKERSARRA